MVKISFFLTLTLALLTHTAAASSLEFTLHKLKSENPGPTLLVIGGIQGDEPGGFTAASLLVTDYSVSSGEVWVVPNLNFESIIKRSRGVYGDMNRKFLSLPESDPEYETVEKIKAIITHQQVDLILNLHDGSGFYNPTYIDKDENPKRWGQSVIIDQSSIDAKRFGDMEQLAINAITTANGLIPQSRQQFVLKNTHTSSGDKEMEKTLTYFAIRHGKPAMGLEASKSYLTHKRALQHLYLVEAIMDDIGIEHSRSFKLNEKAIDNKLGKDIQLALYDKKILFDLGIPRKNIRFVPMKKESPLQFTTNNPLVAVVDSKSIYRVRYGNRSVTTLSPQYFEYDESLTQANFIVDGKPLTVPLGSVINVNEHFMVPPIDGRRVNVIGYKHPSKKNESGILVKRQEISPRFSVDKQAQRYRVEFYKGKEYSGMVLVNFQHTPNNHAYKKILPANILLVSSSQTAMGYGTK